MRVLLAALLLVPSVLLIAPTASADLCEVPFCWAPGMAYCFVDRADESLKGGLKQTVSDRTTIQS